MVFLVLAAAVLGLLVIPLFFLLSAYSSGESTADRAETVTYLALATLVLLACLPVLVRGRGRHIAAGICGVLLLISAFVTVLGPVFIPAGLLLCLAGFIGRDAAAAHDSDPGIG